MSYRSWRWAIQPDADRCGEAPLLLLWGGYGTVGSLFDIMTCWRSWVPNARGRALSLGHSPREEVLALLRAQLDLFRA